MKANLLVSRSIVRERKRSGLSLSALAEKAGIAKSTLSQLEAGQGNPNLETLWSIATALDVPFNFLFEAPLPRTNLVRANEGEAISSGKSAHSATLLAECPPNRQRVLYRLELMGGSIRKVEPHHKGTIEHAFVSSGKVRLGPIDQEEELGPGDYFRYPADETHRYESLTGRSLLLLVIDTPC
ncbi:MAG: XRE family transcriptional regulator [Sneathiellales bacterium]|nr:XRE family transcriptional regulator [Sneathiellales bacterium]